MYARTMHRNKYFFYCCSWFAVWFYDWVFKSSWNSFLTFVKVFFFFTYISFHSVYHNFYSKLYKNFSSEFKSCRKTVLLTHIEVNILIWHWRWNATFFLHLLRILLDNIIFFGKSIFSYANNVNNRLRQCVMYQNMAKRLSLISFRKKYSSILIIITVIIVIEQV